MSWTVMFLCAVLVFLCWELRQQSIQREAAQHSLQILTHESTGAFVRAWKNLECRTRTAGDRMGYKKQVEDGTYIALIHSEASEALEALRRDPPQQSEKIPDFLEVEEELADIVIRVADRSEAKGYRTGEAIMAKWSYNMNRKGDKKF